MKNSTVAIIVIVALGLGYFAGTSSAGMGSALPSEINDSIVMMKKQSASIEKMGEMMKTSGSMMQEFGIKYNDGMMISQGKDLEAVGTKYMQDDAKESTGGGSMNKIIGR